MRETNKMKNAELLTRFELVYDGENQGVGIFYGLDDVGLHSTMKEALLRPFHDELAMPSEKVVEAKKKRLRTKSYFKPEGLKQFSEELRLLQETIEDYCFDVETVKLPLEDVSTKDIVFQDQYQVVIAV